MWYFSKFFFFEDLMLLKKIWKITFKNWTNLKFWNKSQRIQKGYFKTNWKKIKKKKVIWKWWFHWKMKLLSSKYSKTADIFLFHRHRFKNLPIDSKSIGKNRQNEYSKGFSVSFSTLTSVINNRNLVFD